ncbi:MAG: radical SAM protein [Candidatus Riflebacteria bacterium]|nr:radical SAM protein [Candidatus Riflebacteria bacterium]
MRKVLLLQMAPGPEGPAERHSRLWYFGLTLPYVAALFSRHAEVRVVDELLDPLPEPGSIEGVDLVAITVMGAALPRALGYADELRKRGLKVVMGGPTATAYSGMVLPRVDGLVAGDGERLVDRVMADLSTGSLQGLYGHEEPPLLDDTPVPRYDLVDPGRVGFYWPVEATRGCTVGCRFCLTSHLGARRQRQKPVENVTRDVKALKTLGIHRVTFTDDNPAADRPYFRRLIEALGQLDVSFICNVTADVAEDGELLDRLYEAGCETLSIGFETVEQASLDWVDKGGRCQVDRYRATIDGIHQRGMQVLAMMVVGFDHDTPATFSRILAFLVSAKVDVAVFHILTPVAGTPFHQEIEQAGRLLSTNLADYSAERAVFRPAHMTAEELEAGFWSLYRGFYAPGSIVRRLLWRSPDRHVGRRLGTLGANLFMMVQAWRGRTVV